MSQSKISNIWNWISTLTLPPTASKRGILEKLKMASCGLWYAPQASWVFCFCSALALLYYVMQYSVACSFVGACIGCTHFWRAFQPIYIFIFSCNFIFIVSFIVGLFACCMIFSKLPWVAMIKFLWFGASAVAVGRGRVKFSKSCLLDHEYV